MPKTPQQLDREIKAALTTSASQTSPGGPFRVHGSRQGEIVNHHADTYAEAERIARALAKKGFLIDLSEKDPHSNYPRIHLVSNRDSRGRMRVTRPLHYGKLWGSNTADRPAPAHATRKRNRRSSR